MTGSHVLPLVLCLLAAPALQARNAPAPHCVDARRIQDVHQVDAQTLALRTADGVRARVALAEPCERIVDGSDVQLLARGGWLCGAPDDAVRSASRSCLVADVAHVDTRAYADLVRQASHAPPMLDRVVVQGKRVSGFRGTTDDCVRTSGLRGWHEDRNGVVVEVSPRRAGGNRHYRVETVGGCGTLRNAETLQLISGMGLGIVCGNAGDRIVFARAMASAADSAGILQPVMQSPMATDAGCRITKVYPVDD